MEAEIWASAYGAQIDGSGERQVTHNARPSIVLGVSPNAGPSIDTKPSVRRRWQSGLVPPQLDGDVDKVDREVLVAAQELIVSRSPAATALISTSW